MTIGKRTPGAWASGSTSVAPALPASIGAGDMMILFVGCKPYSATINQPSGWTRIGTQQTNGSTGSGIDSGSVAWSVFYRAWQSGDAAPSVSVTSGNVSLGVIHGYTKTAPFWVTPTAYFGSDTSSGTGYSITAASSSGQITSGDSLLHASVIAGNNSTFGTPTLTATSATIGTVTESPATEGSTATGNDLEASSATADCTAGTSTADAVCGWTLSVAQTGGSALVRLRENFTVTGSLAATESGSDTFAGAGDVLVQGTLAATEAGLDVFAATGIATTSVTGSMAAVETGSDTAAATGKVIVQGTLAATETGADVLAATGKVIVAGSLAATEAGTDTFAGAGKVIVQGGFAAVETATDLLAATGGILVQGTFTAVEGADAFAGAGTVLVQGTFAAVEGADTFAATGSTGASITGSMAAVETGEDVFAAAGTVSGVVWPDPAAVLLGVTYGPVTGHEYTGTLVAGYSADLKLDISTGKLIKILSDKVALSL